MIHSEAHPVELTALGRLLAAVAASDRRSRAREILLTLIFEWLSLVAALFVLDLFLSLPVWLRWIGLVTQGALIGWRLYLLVVGWRIRRSPEWAARRMEEHRPDLDNGLINSLQFHSGTFSHTREGADRIRREIARGESLAGSVTPDALDKTREKIALRRASSIAGAWLLVLLLFPSGCRTIFPRLFTPWRADATPPFSLTHFEVTPPGGAVRFGASFKIAIRVSGPLPESVDLVTRTSGSEWRHIALAGEEPDRYSITLDSLQENTWFFVEGGGAESARYLIRVIRPPALRTLRATYSFPAYTGLRPSTETVDETGLHGLPGTRVTLDVQADIPLSGGTLQTRLKSGSEEALLLQVDAKDRTKAAVALVLSQPGSFTVSLTGEEGLETTGAARGPIRIEVDQPPGVWIAEPGQDLLVTPDMKVPVVVESQDDFGISRIQFHRIVNALGDTPLDLPLPTGGVDRRKTHSELTFDLPDLGVRAGDEIRYFATAYDTRPDPPNVTDSEAFTLKVVTPEEFQKALAQQQQDLPDLTRDLASNLSQLAQRQKSLAAVMEQLKEALARSPSDRSLQARLESARKEQRSIRRAAQSLAQQMREEASAPSSSSIERAMRAKLAELAAQLQRASGEMQSAESGSPSDAAAGARAAAERLQAADAQMQRQLIQTLKYLEEVLPLFEDVERFKELANEQGQLVLRALEFRDRPAADGAARARLQQIAARQGAIEEDLRQLAEDFVRHANACQLHFPRAASSGRRIAREIGSRQIPKLMGGARDLFGQRDGARGFPLAQEALRQMEAMIQGGEGKACQANGKQELDLALQRSLGKSGLGQGLAQMSAALIGSLSGEGEGGRSMGVAKAFRPGLSPAGGGGRERKRSSNTIPGRDAPLAPENVEFVHSHAAAPPKAAGADSGHYPPEYRKLVQEYFKSVAAGSQ